MAVFKSGRLGRTPRSLPATSPCWRHGRGISLQGVGFTGIATRRQRQAHVHLKHVEWKADRDNIIKKTTIEDTE